MNALTPTTSAEASEWEMRVDLAAAFRLAVEFDWHESVGNHFSAATSSDGRTFLLNPKWKHFATIKASDLLLLNVDDTETMNRPNAPDATAWCIHGAIHKAMPSVKVLLHCHPPYATALASLKDPTMKAIDQNTARFFGLVGADLDFGGLADEAEEGARLVSAFGNHPILLMGNHGVTVTAGSVAEAFEHLYFFERAAKTLMLAYASGQPLSIMSDEIAEKTAQGWRDYNDMAFAHFDYLKSKLDKIDPSYRD